MIYLVDLYREYLMLRLSQRTVNSYMKHTEKALLMQHPKVKIYLKNAVKSYDFDLLEGLRLDGQKFINRQLNQSTTQLVCGFNAYMNFLEEYTTEKLVRSVMKEKRKEKEHLQADVSDVFYHESIEAVFTIRRN